MCRMCGGKEKCANHLSAASWHNVNKRRHDNVALNMHWQICGKEKLKRTDKWYKHTPERVVENEGFKVPWDFNVKCDKMFEARRSDILC